mgnify:CR=1 FL=1
MYSKNFFKNNTIKSKGFEADHEITAKLIKQGFKIIEVPIGYKPRNKLEGKKINFFDDEDKSKVRDEVISDIENSIIKTKAEENIVDRRKRKKT